MEVSILLLDKIDFHIHPWEKENQIEAFLREYARRGYAQIALTDHYEFSFADPERFAKEREHVEKLREQFGLKMKVFISSEVACLDDTGRLESDEHPYALKDLDYISVAPHHYSKEQFLALGDSWAEHAQEMLLALVRRPDVKVILHPFVHIHDHLDWEGEYMKHITRSFLSEFARLAKKNEKVVEVHRHMTYHFRPLVEELIRHQVRLVVGSDAHSLSEIDDSKTAVALIKSIDEDYPFVGF